MKGRVIFWFHLNYATNSGYVLFKLYGQQCQKCKNGSYEHAMWYPEEVVKVSTFRKRKMLPKYFHYFTFNLPKITSYMYSKLGLAHVHFPVSCTKQSNSKVSSGESCDYGMLS